MAAVNLGDNLLTALQPCKAEVGGPGPPTYPSQSGSAKGLRTTLSTVSKSNLIIVEMVVIRPLADSDWLGEVGRPGPPISALQG